MKNILLILLLITCIYSVNAQDSLNININKRQFNYGDTIVLDYDFKYENKLSATSTLNLWIEDVNTHSIWKYRYPLIHSTPKGDEPRYYYSSTMEPPIRGGLIPMFKQNKVIFGESGFHNNTILDMANKTFNRKIMMFFQVKNKLYFECKLTLKTLCSC
jgi:hypothetical protein